ncbi:MAG: carboxypeptidase [Pseudomonadota bacterium]
MKLLLSSLIFMFMSLCCASVLADESQEVHLGDEQHEPRQSVTEHQVRIDGELVDYRATTGWLIQKKNDKSVARFGYTAYVRDGNYRPGERPLMFAFNGGPGSSSIWLHMGILGPQRVVVDDPNFTPPPPAKRVDNQFSIIDKVDLVMIDPVGTGFSRPIGKAEGKMFWGVDQDIESVGAFIKQYITENGRWASPKFILGESYGGIRGAGLAHYLQSRHGMHLNGVILVSPFLDTSAGRDGDGLDLPHALYLSTFAATAWYHNALDNRPAELKPFLEEVDRFALEQYLPALTAGYTIDPARKRTMAELLAAYTGVSTEYWEKADLRVDHQQYLQELKRSDRLIAGRIDSRFIGPSINPLSETMDYDPFFPAVGPAYTAAFLDYLHNDLEFGRDLEYKTSAWPLDWDWSHEAPNGRQQHAVSLLPDMSMAMIMNPGLHLHIQQGYFDMATPVGATNYYVRHLDIPMDARERIRVDYYEAGHMMYLHQPSMQKYRDDLVAFIESAIPE